MELEGVLEQFYVCVFVGASVGVSVEVNVEASVGGVMEQVASLKCMKWEKNGKSGFVKKNHFLCELLSNQISPA